MNNLLNFTNILAVGLGAALGAWGRWALNLLFNSLLPNLPLGTLIANLSGGLIMGVVLAFIAFGSFEPVGMRLFIITGFLGGLTTFSAFTGESLTLLQKHEYCWAAIHVSSHVFGALLMAAIGYALVQYLRNTY
ncbi:MAG: fluoride efflux transporter CrcB [Methylotenera sp.]|nr:fluoride efflux transporter CrcB [Methylotenera sp.]NOT66581.1 fluoride efflux transporter CrcB [Methylotenera sp.]